MTKAKLTSKQRARLRSRAHKLEPVQHVGGGGVTPAVLRSVEDALNNRDLIKVRVLDGAPDSAYDTGDLIADGIEGAQVVQAIGRVVVLFRPLPDDE